MILARNEQGEMMNYQFDTDRFMTIAHRGASGYFPENTLSAMRGALDMGAPAVELDVFPVEGELIVFHDRRLERLTDGTGVITERSLREVRELAVRGTERIPTLGEVLDLLAGRIAVNIELKWYGAEALVVHEITRRVRTGGWSQAQFLVSSFIHPALARMRDLAPEIPRGVLYEGCPLGGFAVARELGAFSVNVGVEFMTEELIREAKRHAERAFVYTVNHPEDARLIREWGGDGVFTDFPDRIMRELDGTRE
jgi:glycerophosphoryl diester phosphodiesterase